MKPSSVDYLIMTATHVAHLIVSLSHSDITVMRDVIHKA